MTLAEIIVVLQNYKEQEEQRAKEKTLICYTQAAMVAQFVNLGLNGKPIPSYNELFPSAEAQKAQEDVEYKKAMLLKEQFMF